MLSDGGISRLNFTFFFFFFFFFFEGKLKTNFVIQKSIITELSSRNMLMSQFHHHENTPI